MTRFLVTATAVLVMVQALAAQAPIPINKPECMTWDSLYNRYLVSLNLDNDIVQVDTNGAVTMFRENIGSYITSAGIAGTTFYQSDVDRIAGFDLATGNQVFNLEIVGASYIAGAVADTSGNIYVPDIPHRDNPALADKIWKIRLSDQQVSVLITTDEGLGFGPRDMVFDPPNNRLIVTFMVHPVYIQAVSLTDLTVTNLARFKTDYTNGIARDQFGNIYVAGYDNGIIYRYDSAFSSEPEIVSVGHNAPCNIDYNPQDHILAVPCYWGDLLEFLPMGRPELVQVELNDVNGGDGDGFAEAGETCEVIATVNNTHFLPLTDVSMQLIGASGGVDITQGAALVGTISARSHLDNYSSPFEISIPPGTEKQMISLDFEITYTSDYGTEVDTMTALKPVGEVSVLIVDDETGFASLDQSYRDALSVRDSTYDLWWTKAGPPDSAFMSKFDVAIWFTGAAENTPIDSGDIAAIKGYLQGGGNLFLTGQGIASSLDTLDQDFLHNYLHSTYLADSYWPFVAGAAGAVVFSSTDKISINGASSVGNQTVLNHIAPVNGGVAELKYDGQSDWCAVSYDGTYRSLFLSFGFEGIDSINTTGLPRDEAFSKVLAYFDWLNPYHCCEGLAGNVNFDPDDVSDIGDLTALIGYLFIPPYSPPICLGEANIDGIGEVDIGDLTALIGYLFIPPYEPPAVCQ